MPRLIALLGLLASVAIAGQLSADSAEFLIGLDVDLTPMDDHQQHPSVDFGQSNYLVVWGGYACRTIEGVRVSPSGYVLDPGGLQIAGCAGTGRPRVAANDSGTFLVVWNDVGYVRACRVTEGGDVLDPGGMQVSQWDTEYGCRPAVASDGRDWLLTWPDYDYGPHEPEFWLARVTAEGQVRDRRQMGGYPSSVEMDVCFGHDCYAVLWTDCWGRPVCTRLSRGGWPIGGSVILPHRGRWPAIEADSGGYLVVTADSAGQRFGQFLDSVCSPVHGAVINRYAPGQHNGDVSFDGRDYQVVWQESDPNSVYGSQVTTAGVIRDTLGVTLDPDVVPGTLISLAWDGRRSLLVAQVSGNGADVRGTLIDTSGAVSDSFLVSGTACYPNREQFVPAATHNGSCFLVGWREPHPKSGIRFTRVSAEGEVTEGSWGVGRTGGNMEGPGLVSSDSSSLLVWSDFGDSQWRVKSLRICADGLPLTEEPVSVSSTAEAQGNPRVASNGCQYLVAWQRAGPVAARVSLDGSVLDPDGIRVASDSGSQAPSAASNGTDYLVVWASGDSGQMDIRCARLSSAGTVIDSTPLVVSARDEDETDCAAVGLGDEYLIVWRHAQASGRYALRGARVNSAGIVVDSVGFVITDTSLDCGRPSLWSDESGYHVVCVVDAAGVRRGLRVSLRPNGALRDSVLWSQGIQGEHLGYACGPDGRALACYPMYTPEYDTSRIWGRFLGPVGVQEKPEDRVETRTGPTVMRAADLSRVEGRILDVQGRDVTDKKRSLSPGVYYELDASRLTPNASRITKIVVVR